MGVLPAALFASGHTFYIRNLAASMGLEPYAAHNNFQFSGLEGKRHRFRETGLWTQVGVLLSSTHRCNQAFFVRSSRGGSERQSLAALPR